MLNDLEAIHVTLLEAFKALHLLSGTDLEALAAQQSEATGKKDADNEDDGTLFHLPI